MSFSVAPGEILGIIGESGSGKTTTSLALLGYATPGVTLAGRVEVSGRNLLELTPAQLRAVRGLEIAYVPQDPPSALNPSMRVAKLINSMLAAHAGRDQSSSGIGAALSRVDLPTDRDFIRRFPHQLSGGQQQRLAIGAALAARPGAVVFDEPTTGLDLLTQALIVREIRSLRDELGVAMVYVSHDLRVVADLADRVCVMHRGRIVETGDARTVLQDPQHEYTKSLVAAIPSHRARIDAPEPVASRPPSTVSVTGPAQPQGRGAAADTQLHSQGDVLTVQGLQAGYRSRGTYVPILRNVDLRIGVGERVAIAGQSGSGKTTLTRCISGLVDANGGTITFDGQNLPLRYKDRSTEQLRSIQVVFQNPTLSLNPALTVNEIVGRPIQLRRGGRRAANADEVRRYLDLVELDASAAARRPRELSGGQRQRVMIASALAAEPKLLICDEITSALDVSVQAKILRMLKTLSQELQLALLFVSHDLGVITSIAQRTAVIHSGEILEDKPTADLISSPEFEYTRQLIAAADELESFTTRS
nr:ABC transporter ATP-binding protein [Mycolicibacterium confluentis]